VVTGPSGSGKSTFIGLLLGLIKPQIGTVRAIMDEGKSYSLDMNQKKLLKSIGYVGPENFLIDGTIYDNILYGLNQIPSESDVNNALKLSECQFVFDLPHQMNHRLTEQGAGLSAGQKQRLSLCRALLRNPKVLILDEATANLDVDTEERLVKTLATLKRKMTIIGVTHRSALLKIADQHLNFTELEPVKFLKTPSSSIHLV
jgi:ABC-type bacteriocin/lantibiotic exporter with double-glycine peptidase domain